MAEIKIKTPNGNNHVSLTTANASGDATVTLPKASIDLTGGSNGQYLKTDGAGTLSWGTVAATTTSGTDNFTVADGNLVIGTAGHGIDFSATGDGDTGSSSSELLDDYEEGSFTVTFANSVTPNNLSTLHYTKVGNLVHLYGIFNINSDNSNAVCYINNLPYVHAGSYAYSVPTVHTNNWDLPSGAIGIGGYGEADDLRFRTNHDDAAPQQLAADSGAEMFLSYTYRTT